MGRYLLWALGLGCGVVLSAAPAAAQVDIGVWTPNGGGRVVLGSPRVYYPAPVYVYREPPIYVVPPDYYYRPYRGRHGWARGHGRNYGDSRDRTTPIHATRSRSIEATRTGVPTIATTAPTGRRTALAGVDKLSPERTPMSRPT